MEGYTMRAGHLVASLPTVAFAAALVCLGAGCSSRQSSAGGDGSSQAAQSPASQAVGEFTGVTVDAKNSQPCEKLSVSDVQPLFGVPVTKTVETDLAMGTYGCFFTTAPHGAGLQIVTSSSRTVTAQQSMAETGVALSGIGDKAIRQPGDVWVSSVKGAVFCRVQGNHAAAAEQNAAAVEIRGLTSSDVRSGKIPDATAQGVAAQLGALCNKIYGS
jgi:hypothetical protein